MQNYVGKFKVSVCFCLQDVNLWSLHTTTAMIKSVSVKAGSGNQTIQI